MDSLILRSASRFLVGLILLFSIFVLMRGHDEPGGGFIGGLLGGSALALFSLSHGVPAARRVLRVDPRSLIAAGILFLVVSAVAGPLVGDALLTGQWMKEPVPGVGKLSTILVFDLGVYLAVMGTVLLVLFTLGEED